MNFLKSLEVITTCIFLSIIGFGLISIFIDKLKTIKINYFLILILSLLLSNCDTIISTHRTEKDIDLRINLKHKYEIENDTMYVGTLWLFIDGGEENCMFNRQIPVIFEEENDNFDTTLTTDTDISILAYYSYKKESEMKEKAKIMYDTLNLNYECNDTLWVINQIK